MKNELITITLGVTRYPIEDRILPEGMRKKSPNKETLRPSSGKYTIKKNRVPETRRWGLLAVEKK